MGVAVNATGNQAGSVLIIGVTAVYLLFCAIGRQEKSESAE
jgi:hypothetical protein